MKNRILKIKEDFLSENKNARYASALYYLLSNDRTLHKDSQVWDRVYKSAKIIDPDFQNFRYFAVEKAIKALEFAEKYDLLIGLI